jgi:hypothetical protein
MKENRRDYAPFAEWVWKDFDGKKKVSIDEFITNHPDCFFIVGTDSQNHNKRRQCVFTSVLIAYTLGKGGAVIMHRDRVPLMDSLRQRLLLEAMRSLEVAWYLDSKVNAKNIIEIHLDVNANLKWRSAQYKEELVGLIASQGFSCVIKPDSFGASKVADRRCK